jgi:hypothetical protein
MGELAGAEGDGSRGEELGAVAVTTGFGVG